MMMIRCLTYGRSNSKSLEVLVMASKYVVAKTNLQFLIRHGQNRNKSQNKTGKLFGWNRAFTHTKSGVDEIIN